MLEPFIFTVKTTMLRLILCVVVFVCVVNVVYGFEGKSFNMFAKLKSSIQWASKLLGLDKASDVANLVSSAFGKRQKKMDNNNNNSEKTSGNIFSGFLRIFGFDGKKVGAIAVNAIIFVAQLVNILTFKISIFYIVVLLDKFFIIIKKTI